MDSRGLNAVGPTSVPSDPTTSDLTTRHPPLQFLWPWGGHTQIQQWMFQLFSLCLTAGLLPSPGTSFLNISLFLSVAYLCSVPGSCTLYAPNLIKTSQWLEHDPLVLTPFSLLWLPSSSGFNYKCGACPQTSSQLLCSMANNFNLTPEDHLHWQRRAPRASYWFGVSDVHPFINSGQPTGTAMLPPPPPYTPALPTPPTPDFQPYPVNTGVVHAETPVQLPPVNLVPIYDIRNNNSMGSSDTNQNAYPSLPPRKFMFAFVNSPVDDVLALGFIVSVPLKQFRRNDIPSRDEIAFEWDIPYGDFYDRICARMDLDPKEAMLGYKFTVETKTSIVRLPSNGSAIFNVMLEKIKSRIARARTRPVVLEIHNLVCLFTFYVLICSLIYSQEAKKSPVALKKKQIAGMVAQSSLTINQTRELKLLKEKLHCVKGHRPWCWVAPDGTHTSITIFQISLWAQMIVCYFLIHLNYTSLTSFLGQWNCYV